MVVLFGFVTLESEVFILEIDHILYHAVGFCPSTSLEKAQKIAVDRKALPSFPKIESDAPKNIGAGKSLFLYPL